MDVRETIDRLRRAAREENASVLRSAATDAALAVAEAAGDGARSSVGGASYRVEEVTWAVSQFEDGRSAYPCPLPKPALIRGDALMADVRVDYWDGSTWYYPVEERIGRWRRFRMGSPGDRGYDLHLATDEELRAFAVETSRLADALGIGRVEGAGS
jgi:hypothetical protein